MARALPMLFGLCKSRSEWKDEVLRNFCFLLRAGVFLLPLTGGAGCLSPLVVIAGCALVDMSGSPCKMGPAELVFFRVR